MKKWKKGFWAAALSVAAVCCTSAVGFAAQEPYAPSFDVGRFVLPAEARVLVVVEGTGGSGCRVYAYEYMGDSQKTGSGREAETGQKTEASPEAGGTCGSQKAGWVLRVDTAGFLGRNGMSNNRTEGDKTTPIGLFEMNTPFGQSEALPGFPENYIQVTEAYVWTEATNRLVEDPSAVGEHVGTAGYADYYDYVIDMGFNRDAVPGKGAALFLHCIKDGRTDTAGCVAIEKEEMEKIMKLYGTYGDGHVFIAAAPAGTFEQVYDTFGANGGLSPEGTF